MFGLQQCVELSATKPAHHTNTRLVLMNLLVFIDSADTNSHCLEACFVSYRCKAHSEFATGVRLTHSYVTGVRLTHT